MPYVPSWERRAKQEGKKEGIREGKLNTARELIKRGISIEIIAASTQLPVEEIEKLAATIQKEQIMH